MAQVVTGKDLIQFAPLTDISNLEQYIDPTGNNVVGLSIMQGHEIRCNMLLKFKGNDEPVEMKVKMPIAVFNQIVQLVDTDREVMVH